MRRKLAGLGLVLGWLLCGASVTCEAAILHVRPGGDDSASGRSWGEAVRGVGKALALAVPGDEVWVAAGRYTNALVLGPGVGLFGGFSGVETVRSERDPLVNETILDGGGTNVVVRVAGGGRETTVDGFTIQNGAGCGVRLFDSAASITRNRIRWNRSSAALAYGAGVSVGGGGSGAVALISENLILDNYAFDGGGIACIDASPRIERNVIAWNTAMQNGGGISCWRDASPEIEGNAIHGNAASWVAGSGAVPVGGGGVFATADDLDGRPHPTARSSPVLRNNLIAANGAASGGGVVLIDANGGVPVLVNNTVVANSGSGILWGSSALVPIAPVLINNLVAFNPWGFEQRPGTPDLAVIEHNCVFGNRVHRFGGDYLGLEARTGRDGNISVEPRLAAFRYGNLHLQPDSPCRGAGREWGGVGDALDIDGEPRRMGGGIDIGADETDGRVWNAVPAVIRVMGTGDDAADGGTWATAKRTVAAAVDAIRPVGGEVWVAEGTYAGRFWLPAFVHLHGGFAGTESRLEERRPAERRTVLDGGGRPNVVLSGQGGFGVSTLDGFVVTGGGRYTGGTELNKYGAGGKGGGMLIAVSSPVVTNNVITRNSLAYDNSTNQFPSYGAGIACENSFALITGNVIEENEILNDFDGSGAGIYCNRSMPAIVGNRITRNRASYGAAVYAWASSPLILGNTIEENGMYVLMPLFRGAAEGAVSVHLADDLLIEGNRFVQNTAGAGGGIYFSAFRAGEVRNNLFLGNQGYDPTAFGGLGGGVCLLVTTNATSPIRLVHNTFIGNVASNFLQEMGGGIAFTLFPPATNLVIANNLILSNSSGILQTPTTPMPKAVLRRNNLLNQGADYIGLVADPTDVRRPTLFVDPAGGDYRLASGAPDIDGGDADTSCATDHLGVPRPLDGDADGRAAPDIGAWEFVHANADTDGDGLPDGWEVAMGVDPRVADAGEDADADGAVNRDEYTAGTLPRDAGSVLAVRVTRMGGDRVEVTWQGVAGRSYGIERAAVLGGGTGWVLEETVEGRGEPIVRQFAAGAWGGAGWFVRVSVSVR